MMGKNNMNKQQMLRYVGDFSQLFGIREYTLQGGRSKGVFETLNGKPTALPPTRQKR